MAQERGIEQTKELLDFIFSLAEAIKKSTADGEFTWSDGLNFIDPLKVKHQIHHLTQGRGGEKRSAGVHDNGA